MIGDLLDELRAFGASLRRGKAVNVNDEGSKARAVELARHYFADVRPFLIEVIGENESLSTHDETWQQLARLGHGSNARTTYFKLLLALQRQLREFDVVALTAPFVRAGRGEKDVSFSQEETLILKTLEALVPSAATSYRQGLVDLLGPERSSYRGTAAEFRESLRETLDHLAPDADVEAQDWYKPEQDQKKPTMKQKTRYVLTSRGQNQTQRKSTEKTLGLIEELAGEVMRATYDRASLATHIHQSKDEVRRIKRYVDVMFFELLEITT